MDSLNRPAIPRRRAARGVVLLQVLVMVMIVSIIASALLYMTFNRRVMVAQERNSFQARFFAEAAFNQAQECLTRMNWNPTTSACVVPVGAACLPAAACGANCSAFFGSPITTRLTGMPASEDINVTLAVIGGQCRLQVVCVGCLW